MAKNIKLPLFTILTVSLILRLWGIWFGLPYLYHQDETHEVLRALELGAGGFDFHRVTKAGYFYLLFFEYGIYFIVMKLLGFVKSASDFALYFIKEPWSFYLIGRSTTAIIGTLNVYITYKIGKEAYSDRTGVIAALLLAFNYLHSQSSHYITVDVPMTCLATFSLLFIIRMAHDGNLKNYMLAGILAGLAVQTKATAIVLVFPILIAHLYYTTKSKKNSVWEFFFGKGILICAVMGILVLFIGNPGLLLNFKNVLYSFWNMFFGNAATASTGSSGIDHSPNLFLFYLHVLNVSSGTLLFIISIAGFVYILFCRKEEDVILTGYIVSFFVLISMSKHRHLFYFRYLIPILPALMILSAKFIDEIVVKLWPKKVRLLVALMVCLLIVQPGYKIMRENYFLSHKDTRTIAKEWIESNIPAGTRILIEGMRTKPKEDTVPLHYNKNNILNAIERYRGEEPRKAKYFELELKCLPDITYDLVTVGGHSNFRDIAHYQEAGIEYIVLRADRYIPRRDWLRGKWRVNYIPAGNEVGEFLMTLRNNPGAKLVKRFEQLKWNRPGPNIEIYKILQ
jgi:hypothetical protein